MKQGWDVFCVTVAAGAHQLIEHGPHLIVGRHFCCTARRKRGKTVKILRTQLTDAEHRENGVGYRLTGVPIVDEKNCKFQLGETRIEKNCEIKN